MIIFIDVFTEDELYTDALPIQPVCDGVVSIQGKMIVKGAEDFGIEDNNEDGEKQDENAVKVVDIVDAHNLRKIALSKKEVRAVFKNYWKQLKGKLTGDKEAMAAYKKNFPSINKWCKEVMFDKAGFEDFEFYMGQNADLDKGMLIPAQWGAEAAPKFFFFSNGVREEKC